MYCENVNILIILERYSNSEILLWTLKWSHSVFRFLHKNLVILNGNSLNLMENSMANS